MNVDILQSRLAVHGYEILTATDGEEALAIARAVAGPDPARHYDAQDGRY
jgi:CheY-like chemotaxis protein